MQLLQFFKFPRLFSVLWETIDKKLRALGTIIFVETPNNRLVKIKSSLSENLRWAAKENGSYSLRSAAGFIDNMSVLEFRDNMLFLFKLAFKNGNVDTYTLADSCFYDASVSENMKGFCFHMKFYVSQQRILSAKTYLTIIMTFIVTVSLFTVLIKKTSLDKGLSLSLGSWKNVDLIPESKSRSTVVRVAWGMILFLMSLFTGTTVTYSLLNSKLLKKGKRFIETTVNDKDLDLADQSVSMQALPKPQSDLNQKELKTMVDDDDVRNKTGIKQKTNKRRIVLKSSSNF